VVTSRIRAAVRSPEWKVLSPKCGCTPPTPVTGGYQVDVLGPHFTCTTTGSAAVTDNGTPVAGVQMQAHWRLYDIFDHYTNTDCAAVSGSDGVASCTVAPPPNCSGADRSCRQQDVADGLPRLKRLWERALPSKYSPHDLARDRGRPARHKRRGQSPLPQSA